MNDLLELAHIVSLFTICGEGNVSKKFSDEYQTIFYIKSSGTSLHTLSEEDLTLCNLNGDQLDSSHKKASIETLFHAWIMRTFPDINYIAHTHPPHTIKILCSEQIHSFADYRLFPDQIVRNGIKSCVVPYASPGQEILKLIEKHVTKFVEKEGYFPKLILLQNHGIITASSSMKDCASATLMCEKSAEIFIGAHALGGVHFLNLKQVADVDECPNESYRRTLYQ